MAKKVKFFSKCDNQVICMIPNRAQVIDGVVVPQAGKHIRFNNGEYETADKKEIDFLRRHALYGRAIVEVDDVGKLQAESGMTGSPTEKTEGQTQNEEDADSGGNDDGDNGGDGDDTKW